MVEVSCSNFTTAMLEGVCGTPGYSPNHGLLVSFSVTNVNINDDFRNNNPDLAKRIELLDNKMIYVEHIALYLFLKRIG